MCRLTVTGTLAIALAAFVQPALAQASVQLEPRFGLYLPWGFLTVQPTGNDPSFHRKHQVGNMMFGMSGTVFWGATKLEANAAYSPSQVAWTDAQGTRDINARVILWSLRGGRAFRIDEIWTADFAVGAGLLARGGKAWTVTGGALDRALSAAAGASFEVVPGMLLRLAGDVYVSRVRYTSSSAPHEYRPWRQDLFVTMGLGFPLGRNQTR